MDRWGRAGRSVEHEDGPRSRPGPGGDGRAGRQTQGAAGGVLHRRMRDPGAGDGDCRPRAGCAVLGNGGAADHGAGRRGDVSAGSTSAFEDRLRELAPQVLGALVRRYGHFDACEDAVQEALLAAAVQWPDQGVPQNPRGWLLTVASRRVTDQLRSDQARRRREDTTGALAPRDELQVPDRDATLTRLVLCSHPARSPPAPL